MGAALQLQGAVFEQDFKPVTSFLISRAATYSVLAVLNLWSSLISFVV